MPDGKWGGGIIGGLGGLRGLEKYRQGWKAPTPAPPDPMVIADEIRNLLQTQGYISASYFEEKGIDPDVMFPGIFTRQDVGQYGMPSEPVYLPKGQVAPKEEGYFGAFETEPMSAYQQAMVDLQRQELMRGGEQRLSPREKEELKLAWAEFNLAQQRAAEEARQTRIEEYTQPQDWIKRWYAMQMPAPSFGGAGGWQPYEAPAIEMSALDRPWGEMTPDQRALASVREGYFNPESETGRMVTSGFGGGAEGEYRDYLETGAILNPQYQEALLGMGTPTGDYMPPPFESYDAWQSPYPVSSIAAVSGNWIPVGGGEVAQAYEKPGGGYGVSFAGGADYGPEGYVDYYDNMKRQAMEAQKPIGTPPTPAWLPQFSPGQVAGQPLKKLPMRTPSGQLWGQTPPGVKAGLAGYMDWSGYRSFEDMYEHMMEMRPRTSTGAGKREWRPTRQV